VPLDIPVGSTVKDLKQHARCLYPTTVVNRILFGGKMLRDDNKMLSDFGIYKECVVQLMLKKAASPSDIMDPQTIRQIRERQRKRQQTEESIQFGDAVIIRILSASNLSESGTCNPYAVLQYDKQVDYYSLYLFLHGMHHFVNTAKQWNPFIEIVFVIIIMIRFNEEPFVRTLRVPLSMRHLVSSWKWPWDLLKRNIYRLESIIMILLRNRINPSV